VKGKKTMRFEKWCGHDIRFVEHNGEWWAILKDICDALDLRTDNTSNRLESDMVTKIRIDISEPYDAGVTSRARKTQDMLVVNELGIYEALFRSNRPEALKFRRWTASVMQKLRRRVGLEAYEAMRMTEPEIQEDVDFILDTLFWDEKTKKVMQSITVQGGDVEQVEFM
jgi:prophage antirepressor-like protein